MANPVVKMETSLGTITIELFEKEAPITVENFLKYVDAAFYEGTIFHRVIPGFMIQGGGMDFGMNQKKTNAPIKNEAGNKLSNRIGTIAMARTNVVDSATSQFFINVADNDFLDFRAPTPSMFGYCVFGQVTDGMDVVKQIEAVRTTSRGFHQDVPVDEVRIISVKRA
ncbi:MAG: peptidyl-prolyl cis-trans isomerase [Lentisphaeria bacterium]|nr:peptidyl-prolyl cis-trans isomerase [Lentisphaeria bacterium]